MLALGRSVQAPLGVLLARLRGSLLESLCIQAARGHYTRSPRGTLRLPGLGVLFFQAIGPVPTCLRGGETLNCRYGSFNVFLCSRLLLVGLTHDVLVRVRGAQNFSRAPVERGTKAWGGCRRFFRREGEAAAAVPPLPPRGTSCASGRAGSALLMSMPSGLWVAPREHGRVPPGPRAPAGWRTGRALWWAPGL